MDMLPRKSVPPPFVYFCDRACFARFKWNGKDGQAEAASLLLQPAGGSAVKSSNGDSPGSFCASSTAPAEMVVKQEPEDEDEKTPSVPGNPTNIPAQRKCIVKCFSADCFTTDSAPSGLELDGTAGAGTGAGPVNNTVWETETSGLQLEDTRQCVFCNQRGDGQADGPSRLLNFDVDKWVSRKCNPND